MSIPATASAAVVLSRKELRDVVKTAHTAFKAAGKLSSRLSRLVPCLHLSLDSEAGIVRATANAVDLRVEVNLSAKVVGDATLNNIFTLADLEATVTKLPASVKEVAFRDDNSIHAGNIIIRPDMIEADKRKVDSEVEKYFISFPALPLEDFRKAVSHVIPFMDKDDSRYAALYLSNKAKGDKTPVIFGTNGGDVCHVTFPGFKGEFDFCNPRSQAYHNDTGLPREAAIVLSMLMDSVKDVSGKEVKVEWEGRTDVIRISSNDFTFICEGTTGGLHMDRVIKTHMERPAIQWKVNRHELAEAVKVIDGMAAKAKYRKTSILFKEDGDHLALSSEYAPASANQRIKLEDKEDNAKLGDATVERTPPKLSAPALSRIAEMLPDESLLLNVHYDAMVTKYDDGRRAVKSCCVSLNHKEGKAEMLLISMGFGG